MFSTESSGEKLSSSRTSKQQRADLALKILVKVREQPFQAHRNEALRAMTATTRKHICATVAAIVLGRERAAGLP